MRRDGRDKVHLLVACLPGSSQARFYLHVVASEYLLEQVARLRADTKYNNALTALLDRALDPDRLAVLSAPDGRPDNLTALAAGELLSCKLNLKLRRELWADFVDKSYQELTDFAEQTRTIADEIESVNQNSLLAPESQVDPKARDAGIAKQSFRDLPAMIRVWTRAFTERMKHIERLDASVFPRRWKALDFLQWLIEEATGSPHDRLVADLLNVADDVIHTPNDRETKNPKFNEDKLIQQRRRRKHKDPF